MVDFAAQAAAAEETRRRVAEALRGATSAAPILPRDVADAVGVHPDTVGKHLRALVAEGSVQRAGAKGPAWLTHEGRVRYLDAPDGVTETLAEGAPLALRRVLDAMPCEEYRSFVRLTVGAVVARHHLLSTTDAGWPSFVALGPTRLGKTDVLARAVCVALGLRLSEHTALLASRTRGQILGRSVQGKGGGWDFVPAAALGRPVVVYDEIHEARDEPAAAWRDLAHGGSTVEGERGERVDVRPVLVSLGNLGADAQLVGGYGGGPVPIPANLARRGVVLDVRSLRGIRSAVPAAAAAVRAIERTCVPVALSRLRPPVADVPPAAWELLGSVEGLLTSDGAELFDVRALGLASLGVAALMPAAWPAADRAVAAAAVVALDYLTVTTTCAGQVRDDWADRAEPVRAWLVSRLAGAEVPPPTLRTTAAEEEDAADEEGGEERRLVEEFARRRARVVGRLDDALKALPDATQRLSNADRDRLRDARATLKARRAAIEREDRAGGLRLGAGVAAVRRGLARLALLETEAAGAIEQATGVTRDVADTVNVLPGGRPPAVPRAPRGPSRARKPRKGEPPIAGLTWVPGRADLG